MIAMKMLDPVSNSCSGKYVKTFLQTVPLVTLQALLLPRLQQKPPLQALPRQELFQSCHCPHPRSRNPEAHLRRSHLLPTKSYMLQYSLKLTVRLKTMIFFSVQPTNSIYLLLPLRTPQSFFEATV